MEQQQKGICNPATEQQAAALLHAADDILILCHTKPDGDTLGSGFALLYALRALGKRVKIDCADGFPTRYDFLYDSTIPSGQPDFEPAFVVAVDIASETLFGTQNECWRGRVDLCIDHHPSNSHYAAHLLLDASAAATAEVVYRLIGALGVRFDRQIATCVYTGVATDTGCFKFTNTSAFTHRVAAQMIELDIALGEINRRMFDLKTPGRIELERLVRGAIEYYLDGRVAMMLISSAMTEQAGVTDDDLDGISALPRQIEGVCAGVTLRQKSEDTFRISLRTDHQVDASAVCGVFGGGGHMRAAGCTMNGSLESVKARLLDEIGKVVS